MNKKISYLLHSISFILIITLFLMLVKMSPAGSEFLLPEQEKNNGQSLLYQDTSGYTKFPIAFINIDTVINNLNYYHELHSNLEKKQQQLESELNQKAREYQAKEQDFIEKQNKGLLLRTEQQKIYENLMQEQQTLMELREKMSVELAEIEQVAYRRIVNKITKYLEDTYTGEYRYIFGSSFGGNVLYGDPGSDITKEVIRGINSVE